MKRILLFAMIASLIACGNDLDEEKWVDPKPWVLEKPVADKMLVDCPTCIPTEVRKFNQSVFVAIMRKYPHSVISFVPASYKDEEDVNRYCDLRGFSDHKKHDVKNHQTFLCKVEKDEDNKLTDDEFYDFVTICPPPHPCKNPGK